MDRTKVAALLAEILPEYLDEEFFELWQSRGFHLLRNDFFSPVPDTREIPDTAWDASSELVGIDLCVEAQLTLLRDVFPKFQPECKHIVERGPQGAGIFDLRNDYFSGTDALAYYCMVRHLRPRRIIEVGAGNSSLLALEALAKNGQGRLTCIEPYPSEALLARSSDLTLMQTRVEDTAMEELLGLEEGDILFIDSSHVCKVQGDVNLLFLEVLPRIRPGVVVHVHDIFLPREYPKDWIKERHWFWSEQYLLQSFLAFNSAFSILLANSFLGEKYPEELRACFPGSNWWGGGSFWMRRDR